MDWSIWDWLWFLRDTSIIIACVLLSVALVLSLKGEL